MSFTSSKHPIIVIDTQGGSIVDQQRIPAQMGVIDNGQDKNNSLSDPYNNYNGRIEIELRGSATMGFPKKQYRFETQTAEGDNNNVPLLGMPAENDWILYGPYDDQSLIRNVLAYGLSNDIGRYASRTRFCEVVVNDDYRGLYVLMEKLKRDRNRIDIKEMDTNDLQGDSLTGGYIIKVDKWNGENVDGWQSQEGIRYQYHYPKASEIRPEQQVYIQDFIDVFESRMRGDYLSNPTDGYPAILDVDAAVDHFILSEVAKNVDAYRISTYLYKDRDSEDGRLSFGPIWDFNLSFGKSWFAQDGFVTDMWSVDYNETHPFDGLLVPFYWNRLSSDPYFVQKAQNRYRALRQTHLNLDSLFARIDYWVNFTEAARLRNFEKWPRSEKQPYTDDISQMKTWITSRLTWMDANFSLLSERQEQTEVTEFKLESNYPNPFNQNTTLTYTLPFAWPIQVEVFSVTGRHIRTLVDEDKSAGRHTVIWDGRDDFGRRVSSGLYVCRYRIGHELRTCKMILTW